MKQIYLLHFVKDDGSPFRLANHAGHYIGYCQSGLPSRLEYHRSGRGSRLVKALMQVPDVDFVVALLINGDRMLERQLKKRKKTKEICPICRGDAHIAKYGPTGKFFVRFYPHRRAWYASRFSLNGTDVTTASTD